MFATMSSISKLFHRKKEGRKDNHYGSTVTNNRKLQSFKVLNNRGISNNKEKGNVSLMAKEQYEVLLTKDLY